jgi:hypothetical protein
LRNLSKNFIFIQFHAVFCLIRAFLVVRNNLYESIHEGSKSAYEGSKPFHDVNEFKHVGAGLFRSEAWLIRFVIERISFADEVRNIVNKAGTHGREARATTDLPLRGSGLQIFRTLGHRGLRAQKVVQGHQSHGLSCWTIQHDDELGVGLDDEGL